MRVTFDTNTLDKAVRPERHENDPGRAGFLKVNRALRDGRVRGSFSETLIWIEGIGRKDRAAVMASSDLVMESRKTSTSSDGQRRIDYVFRADESMQKRGGLVPGSGKPSPLQSGSDCLRGRFGSRSWRQSKGRWGSRPHGFACSPARCRRSSWRTAALAGTRRGGVRRSACRHVTGPTAAPRYGAPDHLRAAPGGALLGGDLRGGLGVRRRGLLRRFLGPALPARRLAPDQRQQGGVSLEEGAIVARRHEGPAADAEDAALHAEAPYLRVRRREEDAAARLGGPEVVGCQFQGTGSGGLEGAAPVFQKDRGEHGAKRFVGRLRYGLIRPCRRHRRPRPWGRPGPALPTGPRRP